jgi:hypothetical protein
MLTRWCGERGGHGSRPDNTLALRRRIESGEILAPHHDHGGGLRGEPVLRAACAPVYCHSRERHRLGRAVSSRPALTGRRASTGSRATRDRIVVMPAERPWEVVGARRRGAAGRLGASPNSAGARRARGRGGRSPTPSRRDRRGTVRARRRMSEAAGPGPTLKLWPELAVRRARGGHRANAGDAEAQPRILDRRPVISVPTGLYDHYDPTGRVPAAQRAGSGSRDPHHADHSSRQRSQAGAERCGEVPPIRSSSTAILPRRSGRSPGFGETYAAGRSSMSVANVPGRHEGGGQERPRLPGPNRLRFCR